MTPRTILLLLSFAFLPVAVHTQTATLVEDLAVDREGGPGSSDPRELLAVGDKLFFIASHQSSFDRDLWVTDGTAAGTEALGDHCATDCSSSRQFLGTDGRVLYFLGRDEQSLVRLWRSDGTRGGTIPLAPEARFSHFGPITAAVAGGRLFFNGCTEADGCELWASDGTPGGTRMVRDLTPFPFGGEFDELVAGGPRAFFLLGNELWRSDGTPEGTIRLRTFTNNRPRLLTAAGNRLFLVGEIGEGQELWVSDGTPAGTRQLTRFEAFLPFGGFLKPLGNRVYFVVDDGTHGDELWVSDGTAAGTRRLTDFGHDRPFVPFIPEELQEVNGRVVFAANDGLSPRQLWAVRTSARAARPVRLCPPTGCPILPEPNHLVPAGGRLVFQGQVDGSGPEPWSTDGTPQGTLFLADLCQGPCAGLEHPPVPLAGAAFFAAIRRPSERVELWRSDGTRAGTQPFADAGTLVRDPLEIAALGGRVFFAASRDDGVELWASTGPGGATQQVADLVRSAPGSFPSDLRALGERLVFRARGDRGQGLWTTAGAAGSTSLLLADDGPGTCVGDLDRLTVAGGLAYLWCGPSALWRTDGTAAGTLPLAELPFTSSPPPFAALQDRALFAGTVRVSTPEGFQERGELWTSDGTPAGTRSYFNLPVDGFPELAGVAGNEAFYTIFRPGAELQYDVWRTDGTAGGTRRLTGPGLSSRATRFVRLGAQVLFLAEEPSFPALALWRTDASSTVSRVSDLSFGSSFNPVSPLVEYRGAVYFLAISQTGWGLYRSDGTAAGTRLLRNFERESQSFPMDELVVVADRLYFAARDATHGRELWQSDGTAEGTVLVRDLAGNPSGGPFDLTVAGGRLYFSAFDRDHGVELWQSDGTAAGTRLVQDLAPGGASSSPRGLTAAAGRLFFTADDGTVGQELWELPLAATGCQPSPTRLCLNGLSGGRFQVESTWRDFAGNSGVGQAVPLTGDTGTFWFFSPSNVELVVKVLDAQTLNNHFWVFYGALSNVEYTLTVTDTRTGAARRYLNPSGQLASVGDTRAFGPLGAFSQTATVATTAAAAPLPLISERSDPAALAACQPGPRTLCLNGGRFGVTATWKDFQNRTGDGTAVGLTGDTGYFWFFDPANVEVVLKVLDGRGLNGKFWVFYGALSNVEYTLTVTDSEAGTVRTYANPSGRFASVADTGAF